jgi:hypothetical protein
VALTGRSGRSWSGLAGVAVCMLLAVAACGPARTGKAAGPAAPVPAYEPLPVPPHPQLPPNPVGTCESPPGSFSCRMERRISEVKHFIAHQPGTIGVELYDRDTGARWGDKEADTDFPAASTIKLAIITDLMQRQKNGSLTLGPGDWGLMSDILYNSDDGAGDQLWFAYENGGFLQRIRRFGMRSAYFSGSPPYWGFMYCSPRDLDNLMDYVLDRLPAHDSGFIVHRMRRVGPIEQWGVWGAGRDNRPGDKDGWENEGSDWITNTVGFAGPREKYTLAIMDNLGGAGDFHVGSTTLSEVASLLFRGHLGPAPTAEATPNAGMPVDY